MLNKAGVNRLSIGVQSFRDEELLAMNRLHNAEQAESCIKRAQDIGITEISIDLMYGIPNQENKHWISNLEKAKTLEVQHISAYALTVEESTSLYHLIRKKKISNVSDELAAEHFTLLRSQIELWNWEGYEVSNYCKPGHRSKHNTGYWNGNAYIGVGPGAHSFDGANKRRINLPSLLGYVKGLSVKEQTWFEEEILSEEDLFNEKVMTSLRCTDGLNLQTLESRFGTMVVKELLEELNKIPESYYLLKENKITLTEQGLFFADGIASQLFKV